MIRPRRRASTAADPDPAPTSAADPPATRPLPGHPAQPRPATVAGCSGAGRRGPAAGRRPGASASCTGSRCSGRHWHIVDYHPEDPDFLAIGPGGIFQVTVADHGRSKVQLAGDVVQVNGRRPPYVALARRDAARISQQMSAVAGRRIPVVPVVAFLGTGEIVYYGRPPEGCVVTSYRDIGRALNAHGNRITPADDREAGDLAGRVDSATSVSTWTDPLIVQVNWPLTRPADGDSVDLFTTSSGRRRGGHVRSCRWPLGAPTAIPDLYGPSRRRRASTARWTRWAFAVSGATEPCVLLDAAGIVVAASPGCAAAVLASTRPRRVGRRLVDGVLRLLDFNAVSGELPDWEVDKIPPLLAITTGGLARGLLRVPGADGAASTVDAISVPLRDGGPVVGSLTFFAPVGPVTLSSHACVSQSAGWR